MTIGFNSQAERYLNVFMTLPQSLQGIVLKTLEHIAAETPSNTNTETLSETFSGRRFSAQERLQLEMDTLERHYQHRRQLLENAFTAPQVAKLLGTSRQTPHDRVGSQTLLAIKENGKLLFPSWQFDPAGPDGVLEGLPQILKTLAMSDYAKLNWLMRPNPYLDGLTPVQALKQGPCDRVIQAAETAGADQWS